MSKILVILGNGFSIDMMHKLGWSEKVDLSNLFADGSKVPWPADGKPGFLSYQYCSYLCKLGALSVKNSEEANNLIELVISCASILPQKAPISDAFYIKAYMELEPYLCNLLKYYTQMNIADFDLKKLHEWGWYKFFDKINESSEISKVDIISLNYDVWLELMLDAMDVDYDMFGFTKKGSKFRIYKPHGSIAFFSKLEVSDPVSFSIDYNKGFNNYQIDDFIYDISKVNTSVIPMYNAMIPPSGDSGRLSFEWAKTIRDGALSAAGELTDGDSIILCGLSYWHVDRSEIDRYISAPNNKTINAVMVNPNSPKNLEAVLTTLYTNLKVFPNSDIISDLV